MPLYCIVAHDHADACGRRLAARPAHIALGDALVLEGTLLFGAAILGEGHMRGSVLIGQFPDREAVERWLAVEPYAQQKVWDRVEIHEIRVGPSFAHALAAMVPAKPR